MTGLSHFSPFRVLDTSLMASGSVYMNERPKLGSEQGGLTVHLGSLQARLLNRALCRSTGARHRARRSRRGLVTHRCAQYVRAMIDHISREIRTCHQSRTNVTSCSGRRLALRR
jgi:hypothetical protein